MQFLDDIFVQFGIVFGYNANVVVNVVDARAISDYRGDDLLKISVTIFTRKKVNVCTGIGRSEQRRL